MVTSGNLSPPLRGRSPQEQARIAQALIAASKESRFPLVAVEMRALTQFVMQINNGNPVDDTLLMTVQELIRRYEERLMARARGDR